MVGRDTTVADIMTTALFTVSPEEPIESVEFAMKLANVRHAPVVGPHNRLDTLLADRIGCVPVVGEDRQLIGIVTESNFLRLAREALVG